jgi:hypothetical protein
MALSICVGCADLLVHKKRGGGLANPRCFTCEPLTSEERRRRMFFAAKAQEAAETGKQTASAFDRPIWRRPLL